MKVGPFIFENGDLLFETCYEQQMFGKWEKRPTEKAQKENFNVQKSSAIKRRIHLRVEDEHV